MKYLPLLWANLWRRKTRTIFTLLSVAVAFLLYGALATIDDAFENPQTGVTGVDKLITTNKFSLTLQLPFSDVQQIAQAVVVGREDELRAHQRAPGETESLAQAAGDGGQGGGE